MEGLEREEELLPKGSARPALGDGVGLGLAKLCLVHRRKPGRSVR